MKPIHLLLGAGALIAGYQVLRGRKKTTSEDTKGTPRRRFRPGGPSNGGDPGDPSNGSDPAGTFVPFPSWPADQEIIQTTAAGIWNAREDQVPSPGALFVTTRDTLMTLWPDSGWPQTLGDVEPVAVPGAPGVFEPKWVVEGGPTGNALKMVWDPTVQYVSDLAFGGQMPT